MHCFKAFINESFLQAHIARRHPKSANLAVPSTHPLHAEAASVTEATPLAHAADEEFSRELEEIRERLRNTESRLVEERNSRLELLKQVQKSTLVLFVA